ncbi:MAG: hypothetical protein JG776_813 [Caloramator sp.]|jgi:hypothetical protein|uniref:DUF342 domain-containing protein n=1 Tax=Caloramator sp. TaxID=1871330 RepID=UPI001DE7D271|nr:flagellar assembly protein A [Caloramator sp.]MBZ4663116.1 hypothetical protein [Caloramator sp.]
MIIEKNIISVDGESKAEILDNKLYYYLGNDFIKINFNKNLFIKINGKIVEGISEIKPDDIIDIDIDKDIYKKFLNIEINNNGLEAVLKLDKNKLKNWRLKNTPKSTILNLDFEFTDEFLLDTEITMLINEYLKENKIVYGVKWENVKSIIDSGYGVIAQGKSPVEPIDDKIEYFFGTNIENDYLENEKKVDFYNSIKEVEFVESGKVLAIVHSGQDGVVGFDVFGRPINPRKREVKKLKKGPGCEVLDNFKRAIAQVSGMPRIKNDSICVFPTYKIKGDVDKQIGNIEYNGSIYIDGNVLEGIKIVGGKEIIIKGNVVQAEIYSNSDINISGNVIGSNLTVGAQAILYITIYNYLIDIKDYLSKLNRAIFDILQSKNNEQFTQDKLSKLLKIIIFSKFKNEKEKVNNNYNNLINLPKLDLNMKKQLQVIQNYINSMEVNGDINLINNTLKIVESLIQNITIDISPADIYVMYCQNSNIISTNNVEILGTGCYNTNINAENSVIFKLNNSVLRSGKIEAKKYIKAGEVGSTHGVTTTLKTTKEGVIEVEIAYQNTILIFDEIKYKIDEPVKKLKAYVKKGELIVEKFKL